MLNWKQHEFISMPQPGVFYIPLQWLKHWAAHRLGRGTQNFCQISIQGSEKYEIYVEEIYSYNL